MTPPLIGFLLASVFVGTGPALAATWEPLGPLGAIGQSIAIDPLTPDTVYLGVYTSGVWKSTDRGTTWTPPTPGIDGGPYSIAVDRLSPSIIYAGGFEDIVRSADGGATWTHLNTGLMQSENAYALAIDPATPSTIYAGAAKFTGVQTGGVLKSVDSGTTWVRTNVGLTDLEVYALAIDPLTTTTLYAGTGSGVFKSEDGGANWAIAGTGAAGEARAVVVDPTSPSIVWAGTEAGVYRSGDGGATWSPAGATTIGGDIVTLALDPSTPGVVYAGSYSGLDKSVDGGATWARTAGPSVGLAIDPGRPAAVYSVFTNGVFKTNNAGGTWFRSEGGLHGHDTVSVANDPTHPGTFYGSGFNVMYTTTDFGATWTSGTVPTSDIFWLAVDPRHHRVSFVTEHPPVDGSAGYWTSNGGRTWRRSRGLYTEAARAIAAAPSDPRIMYAATYDGIFRSRTGGRNWRLLPGGPVGAVLGIAVDPTSVSTAFAGVEDGGVVKTTDGGATWEAMNAGITDLDIGPVAIDPQVSATVYAAGFLFSRVFKSSDGGASWNEGSSGLPQGPALTYGVTALLVDPADSSVVYAGVRSAGMFRSTDGGASWAAFGPGLTALSVSQLIVGPGSTVYAGTSQGLFRLVTP